MKSIANDSDLTFTTRTNHHMFRVKGSFTSYFNFYMAIMAGFGEDYNRSLFIVNDNIILCREHYLKNLN